MKKMLKNNLGLKFLSVVIAIMLWMIVLNIDDPYRYQEFSPIQVTMLNEDVVTDQGKVYRIEDNSDVISVRVWAKNSVLRELSAEDFIATADMKKNIKFDNLVGIEVACTNKNVEATNITKSRENVVISIEDASTEQFNVVVRQTSDPPKGYMVGTAVSDPSLIQISGPVSVVAKIERVVAEIDPSTFTSDRTVHCSLKLLDDDGEELEASELATLEFEGKEEGVDVTVTMLRTKEVPIQVGYTGTPDENYSFSSISYKPETVEIAGASDIIADVTSIVIPDEAVNIDGITENLQLTIDITPYLPSGVKLADEDATVAVVVEIEKKQGKTIEIPVTSIGLKNTPKGYEADFGDLEEVEIIVMGTSADLAALNTDEIAVSLDLSGCSKAGSYTRTLEVTLPGEEYTLMGEVEVEFELVRSSSSFGTTGTTGSGSTGSGTSGSSAAGNGGSGTDTSVGSGDESSGSEGDSSSGSSQEGTEGSSTSGNASQE